MNSLWICSFYLKECIFITKLITLDSSTNKTGIGYYNDGTYAGHDFINCSDDKLMDSRFKSMSKSILKILDQFNPDILYLEEAVVVRNAQTQRFLIRLQGVIYGWCINNNCEFNTIRPTTWRKLLNFKQGKNIKREQLKEQSKEYVKNNYMLDTNDDVADALCIGSAVLKMLGSL